MPIILLTSHRPDLVFLSSLDSLQENVGALEAALRKVAPHLRDVPPAELNEGLTHINSHVQAFADVLLTPSHELLSP